jgi:hypothetical protein
VTDPDVKKKISSLYDNRLFRDVDDVFVSGKDGQFYTMAVTTFPGDQGDLAEWLYGKKDKELFKKENNSFK